MRYKNFGNFIVGLLIFLFFSGCSKSVESLKTYKEEFLSSYNSKDNYKNIQKNQELYALYRNNFTLDKEIEINNEKLSKKQGQLGLWLPSKFIKDNGGGLYFLDKYDSSKKVIVFIHGAGGNGIEWQYILNNINFDIYQALILSYPSGLGLDIVSKALFEDLISLKEEYKIQEFIFIAHSMGGLIANKTIQMLNQKSKYVNKFISLSTPWDGHEGAKGVKRLPYYIPSWDDMRSNSLFIKSLKTNRVFDTIEYNLLFGYKGDDTMFSRDNDGVISLQSQLSQYAQDGAEKVYGFNETHISILQSKDVAKRINNILNNKLQ